MLQQHQRVKKFSEQATSILSAAWMKNTKSKYEGAIKSYISFCQKRRLIHTFQMITYLLSFSNKNLREVMSSFAPNGMITAIKEINSQPSTEIVRTFKKAAFSLHPPVTKYHRIWHPDVLLETMDTKNNTI